jgi:endonuclease G
VILARQEIAKAKARAAAVPLAALAETHADKTPADLADAKDKRDRLQFLRKSQGDTPQTLQTFERIIAGNELQPVNYLELGVLAARPVCRIRVGDTGGRLVAWATGFLIAPQVLITNNHVLPSAAVAATSSAQFDYELDVFGGEAPLVEFSLRPDDLFYASEDLDFAVCAVAPASSDGAPLSTYGFLPLIGTVGKVMDGEWLSITQHPNGERKQVCVRENHLLTRTDEVLWYSTDTLGGSSGSPVFNNNWQVVALHHSGVPEEKNGVPQTVDGRDYDPSRDPETAVKWIANEGIRVSRIVDRLKSERPSHPLLADVFEMTPARARAVTEALLAALPRPAARSTSAKPPIEAARFGPGRSVTVTLDISEDGAVSLRKEGVPRPPQTSSAGLIDSSFRKGSA